MPREPKCIAKQYILIIKEDKYDLVDSNKMAIVQCLNEARWHLRAVGRWRSGYRRRQRSYLKFRF